MKSVTKTFSGGTSHVVGLTAAQKAGLYSFVINGTLITGDNTVYTTYTNCVAYITSTDKSTVNDAYQIAANANGTSSAAMYYKPWSDILYFSGSGLSMGTITATFYYFE